MKRVKIKPFGVFKITDEVLESVEKNSKTQSDHGEFMKDVIKQVKRNGTGQFIAVMAGQKELFTFVPIINDYQLFAAHFPDPIQLYFSLAYSNYQFTKQMRYNITYQKSQGQTINFVNSYLYNWHLKCKISTIIFLHSTIEAFINYLMPEEFIFRQEFVGQKSDKFTKTIKEYNKEQTERYILFKEKLNGVILQLTQIDFQKKHQRVYDKLLNLNLLRNDIIHLRSTKNNNQQHFQKVFDEVINSNLTPFVNAVKDFINIIKPNFIELEEADEPKYEVMTFRFESHAAFKLDISIFIEILATKTKKVVLSIPKSDDINGFQFTMNWIMQNLDILAKKQLIYFPVIKSKSKYKVLIEIIKTDTKVGEKPIWDDNDNDK